eukprot:10172223-Heterocapsa_arctica.AAC.1
MRDPGSQGFYSLPHDLGNGVPPFTMPEHSGTQPFPPDIQGLVSQVGWGALRRNAEQARSPTRSTARSRSRSPAGWRGPRNRAAAAAFLTVTLFGQEASPGNAAELGG